MVTAISDFIHDTDVKVRITIRIFISIVKSVIEQALTPNKQQH